ncbi:hypothetical protein JXC34_07315 [Candidatus Woesearchaeota archaeon]|nr:hypothetical protein [Candidatus Woesearchaeota archaeon]
MISIKEFSNVLFGKKELPAWVDEEKQELFTDEPYFDLDSQKLNKDDTYLTTEKAYADIIYARIPRGLEDNEIPIIEYLYNSIQTHKQGGISLDGNEDIFLTNIRDENDIVINAYSNGDKAFIQDRYSAECSTLLCTQDADKKNCCITKEIQKYVFERNSRWVFFFTHGSTTEGNDARQAYILEIPGRDSIYLYCQDLLAKDFNGSIVFTSSCYGANINQFKAEDSNVMAAIERGAIFFMGQTNSGFFGTNRADIILGRLSEYFGNDNIGETPISGPCLMPFSPVCIFSEIIKEMQEGNTLGKAVFLGRKNYIMTYKGRTLNEAWVWNNFYKNQAYYDPSLMIKKSQQPSSQNIGVSISSELG